MKVIFKLIVFLFLILFFNLRSVVAQIDSNQLPSGATIVSGNITIAQKNGKLSINQTSKQGIIQWNTFNVGSNAEVHFNHANQTDTLLNLSLIHI